MPATKDNPAEDRIILERFFRFPRARTRYVRATGKPIHRPTALGKLISWLLECTKPIKEHSTEFHSIKEFSEELGWGNNGNVIRNISHIYPTKRTTGGEVFTQLSYWIEEIFGYKDDEGIIRGPIIEPDKLIEMSIVDDPKGMIWMEVASMIQNHVKGSMRSRGLKV